MLPLSVFAFSFLLLQELLPSEIADNLLLSVWELPDLCSLLGHLDISLAFLISIGGKEDTRLTDFLVQTLHIQYRTYNSMVSK